MYNNIGLSSVRGTATSGHVQANRGYVRPSSARYRTNRNPATRQEPRNQLRNRGANKEIQEHERKRRIENKLLELRERLEDAGRLTPEEIEKRVDREREFEEEKWSKQLQLDKAPSPLDVEDNPLKNGGMDGPKMDPEGVETSTALVPAGQLPALSAVTALPDDISPVLRLRLEREAREHRLIAEREDHVDRVRGRGTFPEGGRFAPPPKVAGKRDTNSHVDAERKEAENAKLRNAFGIRGQHHVVGAAFDRDLQEKKKLERKAIHEAKEKAIEKETRKQNKVVTKEKKQADKEARRERKIHRKKIRSSSKSKVFSRERNKKSDYYLSSSSDSGRSVTSYSSRTYDSSSSFSSSTSRTRSARSRSSSFSSDYSSKSSDVSRSRRRGRSSKRKNRKGTESDSSSSSRSSSCSRRKGRSTRSRSLRRAGDKKERKKKDDELEISKLTSRKGDQEIKEPCSKISTSHKTSRSSKSIRNKVERNSLYIDSDRTLKKSTPEAQIESALTILHDNSRYTALSRSQSRSSSSSTSGSGDPSYRGRNKKTRKEVEQKITKSQSPQKRRSGSPIPDLLLQRSNKSESIDDAKPINTSLSNTTDLILKNTSSLSALEKVGTTAAYDNHRHSRSRSRSTSNNCSENDGKRRSPVLKSKSDKKEDACEMAKTYSRGSGQSFDSESIDSKQTADDAEKKTGKTPDVCSRSSRSHHFSSDSSSSDSSAGFRTKVSKETINLEGSDLQTCSIRANNGKEGAEYGQEPGLRNVLLNANNNGQNEVQLKLNDDQLFSLENNKEKKIPSTTDNSNDHRVPNAGCLTSVKTGANDEEGSIEPEPASRISCRLTSKVDDCISHPGDNSLHRKQNIISLSAIPPPPPPPRRSEKRELLKKTVPTANSLVCNVVEDASKILALDNTRFVNKALTDTTMNSKVNDVIVASIVTDENLGQPLLAVSNTKASLSPVEVSHGKEGGNDQLAKINDKHDYLTLDVTHKEKSEKITVEVEDSNSVKLNQFRFTPAVETRPRTRRFSTYLARCQDVSTGDAKVTSTKSTSLVVESPLTLSTMPASEITDTPDDNVRELKSDESPRKRLRQATSNPVSSESGNEALKKKSRKPTLPGASNSLL